MVLERIPQAQFWCFGEGPLHQELNEKAISLGISNRFRLLGFRRDVPNIMRAIDVMALPSHREPFGLVYVEAGLCSKPVIASAAGGAPEIVKHGTNGLLVPPLDPSALAEAIGSLLDNREQSAAMGRRGRELVIARFSWSRFLPELRQLYERVLGEQLVARDSDHRHVNRAHRRIVSRAPVAR